MKYVITGGSGYIGTRLTERLARRRETEKIVIVDVKPPRYPQAKVEFHKLDVRDRPAVHALLEREQPDALVHLAFILNPMRDEATMYDIDVNGTLNVLDAASAAGTPQVLVTSSTTAYGAWPDNPELIDEDWVQRGQPTFAYARDKTEADRLCRLWAAEHPDRIMTIVRPCIVLGPNVENYIVRTWDKGPFVRLRGVADQPVQFVHEDDVAEAIAGLLAGKHGGAFNVTGEGTMTWQETADAAGLETKTMHAGLVTRLNGLMWKLGVKSVESPPGNLEFLKHRWVCSNAKVKETLGWEPGHTSRETFEETMRARKGQAAATPASEAVVEAASTNGHMTEDPAAVA